MALAVQTVPICKRAASRSRNLEEQVGNQSAQVGNQSASQNEAEGPPGGRRLKADVPSGVRPWTSGHVPFASGLIFHFKKSVLPRFSPVAARSAFTSFSHPCPPLLHIHATLRRYARQQG